MKKICHISVLFIILAVQPLFDYICAQEFARINIQTDTVSADDIIDGKWVAVGINKPYAIMRDSIMSSSLQKPVYRFELREDDNTINGLFPGDKVSRAELSYCYAVNGDYATSKKYRKARKRKTVHYAGKGSCRQASHMFYSFSIYVPSEMEDNVDVIFAQWHSMPTRTVVSDPEGNYYSEGDSVFDAVYKRMAFKKGKGFENGKPNGWRTDHGGHPVMAFGFRKGYFYIKANSDSKWITDIYELCDSSPESPDFMEPVSTKYKSSVIVDRISMEDFPKNTWVTFCIDVKWSKYGRELDTVVEPGELNIDMEWESGGVRQERVLAKHRIMNIGRNDVDGYYFKCGAYRIKSTVPVKYYITDFSQKEL